MPLISSLITACSLEANTTYRKVAFYKIFDTSVGMSSAVLCGDPGWHQGLPYSDEHR